MIKPGVGAPRGQPPLTTTSALGGYFGVYDGHGGRSAVDFVYKHLDGSFLEELASGRGVADAFERAFVKVDTLMMAGPEYQQCGTTVLSCFIQQTPKVPLIFIYLYLYLYLNEDRL